MKTKTKTAKKTASKTTRKDTAVKAALKKRSASAGTKLKPGAAVAIGGKTKTGKSTLKLTNGEPEAARQPASAPVPYQIEETTLLLSQLTPGPWQDRTDFPEAYIADLASSIEEHGILQRLWVRPMDKPGKKGETHHIIAGECRWRAAQRTRHLVAPVTIYHVTPDQAKILSIIENLQRENLNAMDEAHGFRQLQDAGWSAWDEANPDRSIGHKCGKSKTYVYAALKLTDLGKQGQAAVRSGELSPSVAVRIARIPNPAQQKEALESALRFQWSDERAAREIEHRYMTELKGAPFDRKDATLVPERGTCDACPLRSGNQKEMFGDLAKGRADICTDPTCFRKKCGVSFDRRADAHEQAGGTVLNARQADEAGLHKSYSSIGGKWVNLNAPCYDLPGALEGKKPADVLKAALKEDPTLVTLAKSNDGREEIYELIGRDDLHKLLKTAGLLKKDASAKASSENDHARQAREQRQLSATLLRHQLGVIAEEAEQDRFGEVAFHRALVEWLIDKAGKDSLRWIADRRELDIKGFRLEDGADPSQRVPLLLRSHARELDEHQLRGLLAELLAVPVWTREGELSSNAFLRFLDLDAGDLFERALHATPAAAPILQERELLGSLTPTIVGILIAAPDRTLDEDDLMDQLEKAKAFQSWPDDFQLDGLDDWWTAHGMRDGRLEKRGWDSYRLREAVTEAPQI